MASIAWKSVSMAIATAITVAACGPPPAAPEEVVRDFYAAISRAEIAAARRLFFLPRDRAREEDVEQWTLVLLRWEAELTRECGGTRDVSVAIRVTGDDAASAHTVVQYNGKCAAKVEAIRLVKVDDHWRVAKFLPLHEAIWQERNHPETRGPGRPPG